MKFSGQTIQGRSDQLRRDDYADASIPVRQSLVLNIQVVELIMQVLYGITKTLKLLLQSGNLRQSIGQRYAVLGDDRRQAIQKTLAYIAGSPDLIKNHSTSRGAQLVRAVWSVLLKPS